MRQQLQVAESLGFCVKAALLISSIACASAATYIIVKLCFWTARWLDKVWFSKPW